MGINLGSGTISKLYLGATEIQKAYLGGSLVYDVGGAAWTPANLASLAAWWDASDLSTITESGGSVSQWDDKSGNANHGTQLTASLQPSTGITSLNGLNVIDFLFDGLEVSNSNWGDYVTIVAVVFHNNTSGKGIFLDNASSQSFGSSNGFRADFYDVNDSRFGVNASIATNSNTRTTNPTLTTKWYDGANIYDSINGNTPSSVAKTGVINYTGTTCLIGYQFNYAAAALTGYIAELMIVSEALSLTNRQKAEGYLAHKWGLTADLPAGHPYKTVAP